MVKMTSVMVMSGHKQQIFMGGKMLFNVYNYSRTLH